jgi:hypothetical protein
VPAPEAVVPATSVGVRDRAEVKAAPKVPFILPVRHCLGLLGEPLNVVPALVAAAVRSSNWGPDYALSDRYAIAVETPKATFFFVSTYRRHITEVDLKKISKLIAPNSQDVYCGDWKSENDSDGIIFVKLENRDSIWNPRKYQFVTAQKKISNKQDRWYQISFILGDILVLQEEKLTKNVAEELQRTIIHEGMHLFGQPRMISIQPTLMGGTVDPRIYLEYLDAEDISYRNLVTQEICIHAEIVKIAMSSDPESKMKVALKLKEVFEVIFERQQKFHTSNSEAYWYFVEGVPQYLDQNFIFKSNPHKVNTLYENYCARGEGVQGGFYANYAGASILHGLESLFGSEGEWRRQLGLNRVTVDNWLLEISETLNNHIQLH